MEEGGIKITQIECSTYKENWRENYIWMDVSYKGMLKMAIGFLRENILKYFLRRMVIKFI